MRGVCVLSVLLVVSVAPACNRGGATDRTTTWTTPAGQGAAPKTSTDLAYVCPMDRDIRSSEPGKCSRCGMALVAGIPDQSEYHLDLTVAPKPPRPGDRVRLTFEVFDPWKDHRVEKFSVVHEKLFHAFIISRDLQFFLHDHPTWENGAFHYDIAFPRPGMYRVLGDFYPEGAAPQLITDTIFVAGAEPAAPRLSRDYSAKDAENLKVDFSTRPAEPVAGVTTQMRLSVTPGDGLEKYLGAWGHMLVASDDLIDLTHTHPFIADGSPAMQFSVVFARPRVYRVWVQFQRHGVVNTAHFDVPVTAPESTAAHAG
jgi:Heavy metal binding domain